jgi:non-specific serine/threonine protein kinase/serine/threonine-protein kinase
MTPGSWARISELFEQALERSVSEREALLAELGRSDAAAARELASLLEAHERTGEFLPDLPAVTEAPDLTGRVVGVYRLLRILGAGGTGAVYLAERHDGAFDKRVAVKLLSTVFVQSRERFLRERQVLARLEHPNIARLVDGGATADHLLYLVMEYVDGVPIDRYCADKRLSVRERVALLLQVCAGVAHAHRNLIVHCDLKPENILVTPEGVVKLLDFGIARLLGPASAVTRLRPATPAYASPEQLAGGDISTASDVYSLGVLAYVVLTGHGPYVTASDRIDAAVFATLHGDARQASAAPALPPQDRRALRGDLDNVLAKAIAREPHRRYASTDQFAGDLDAWRTGFPVRARPDTMAYRLRRTVGRHRWAVALAAVLSTGLVATAVISVRQARLAERRLEDLRAFARSIVFDVNDILEPIPGTTSARKLVVETGLQYLDRLGEDRVESTALREELAAAYLRIGKVQGGSFVPNLGDSAGALASFRKALAVAGEAATPALERLRIEGLIAIAQLSVDPASAASEYANAVSAAERRLSADPSDVQAMRLEGDAYQGLATVANLTNDVAGHLPIAVRQVPLRERIRTLGGGDSDVASLARAIAQVALAYEQRGSYDDALAQLVRAQSTIEAVLGRSGQNQLLRRGLAEARSRKIPVLAALGRLQEASQEAEAVVALLQPLVDSDPLNIPYRADLSYAYVRLADVRAAERRVDEALALHRQALVIRRERAGRYAGFLFVPWELTRSLNAVADALLAVSPPGLDEARNLFAEARAVGLGALEHAPSYTQVRRQVAVAEEGLARIATLQEPAGQANAAALWRQAAARWREVLASSAGDATAARNVERVDALTAALTLRR